MTFTIELDVRDYECDLQGIVNNAVYQHYLEHARHMFLRSCGMDFAEITARGINLVVTRIEIDYLYPLRSGDRFQVSLALERVSRLRFGFRQQIIRVPDQKPIVRAFVTGTAIGADGRPRLTPELEQLLAAPVSPGEAAGSS